MHPSDEVNTAGCRAPEDKLDENEFDLRTPSNYRQEKKKAANKKRKTSTYTRSRTSFVEQEEEEEYALCNTHPDVPLLRIFFCF